MWALVLAELGSGCKERLTKTLFEYFASTPSFPREVPVFFFVFPFRLRPVIHDSVRESIFQVRRILGIF